MKFQLVVLKPFQGFQRGDMIKDAVLVDKILTGPDAEFVVRVANGKE